MADVTCTLCGCTCDDLQAEFDAAGQIVRLAGECTLSAPILRQACAESPGVAEIGGKPTDLKEAIARAVEILSSSRAPLVTGLTRSTVESQRVAVEIAERLGAVIDPAISKFHRSATVAMQSVGISTCTLGEVKQRADVILFWGCDPVASHPRLFERFIDAPGKFVPAGRRVIVVDSQPSKTSQGADEFIQISSGSDLDVLAALRAMEQGISLAADEVRGTKFTVLRQLLAELQSAQYAVVFFGSGIAQGGIGEAVLESLFLLVRSLNASGRCAALGLGGPLAENVLTWQSGYPCGVNFSAGYPVYEPYANATNALLEHQEVDAVLIAGEFAADGLSPLARQHLKTIPTILLETVGQKSSLAAEVRVVTSRAGIQTGGTLFRLDGVPIPLRESVPTQLPDETKILSAILQGIQA